MLVIFRRAGDSLYIGESIEIIVDSIEDGTVKLLVDAPREIEIHRDDYYRPGRRTLPRPQRRSQNYRKNRYED